jgi:hypothetical protein
MACLMDPFASTPRPAPRVVQSSRIANVVELRMSLSSIQEADRSLPAVLVSTALDLTAAPTRALLTVPPHHRRPPPGLKLTRRPHWCLSRRRLHTLSILLPPQLRPCLFCFHPSFVPKLYYFDYLHYYRDCCSPLVQCAKHNLLRSCCSHLLRSLGGSHHCPSYYHQR